jgi:hypothetical protein
MTQLFGDDFESGDFSAWNSTSAGGGAEEPTVTTANPHYGSYHMQYVVMPGYWSKATKTIISSSTVYVRAYFRLDTLPSLNKQCNIISCSGGGGSIAKIYAANNAGGIVWKLSLRENGIYQHYFASAGPNVNSYYCVELYVNIDASVGEATIYVNGLAVASTSGKKTDNNGNITGVDVGEYDGYGGTNTVTVSIDDVAIADAYIGPEDAFQSVIDSVSSVDSSLTDKMFLISDGLMLAENCLAQKSLRLAEDVFLVETVEFQKVKRTKLFLVLGDLAIQLTPD